MPPPRNAPPRNAPLRTRSAFARVASAHCLAMVPSARIPLGPPPRTKRHCQRLEHDLACSTLTAGSWLLVVLSLQKLTAFWRSDYVISIDQKTCAMATAAKRFAGAWDNVRRFLFMAIMMLMDQPPPPC